jgi:hypothetical protein
LRKNANNNIKKKKKENDYTTMIKETENQLNIWNDSLKMVNFNKDDEWKSFRFET